MGSTIPSQILPPSPPQHSSLISVSLSRLLSAPRTHYPEHPTSSLHYCPSPGTSYFPWTATSVSPLSPPPPRTPHSVEPHIHHPGILFFPYFRTRFPQLVRIPHLPSFESSCFLPPQRTFPFPFSHSASLPGAPRLSSPRDSRPLLIMRVSVIREGVEGSLLVRRVPVAVAVCVCVCRVPIVPLPPQARYKSAGNI